MIMAIVAVMTKPDDRSTFHPSAAAFIAWAVVCVAMVAGLVTWAVLR